MASSISTAFIDQFDDQVHLLFQRQGSKFGNTTRKGTVKANTVTWQKMGALTAQQKTRNGMHSFIDPAHTKVQATLTDYYVPTLIDERDLEKLNIDERNAHAQLAVWALGRQRDALIIAAMEAGADATTYGGGDTVTLTVDHCNALVAAFNEDDVPDDGNRFCAVTPKTWSKLMKLDEFSNADYVGPGELPYNGMTAKIWNGFMWFVHSGLTTNASTDVATNLAWHTSAIGEGIEQEIKTDWDWENTYSAWSCVSQLSMAAKVIEDTGVKLFNVDAVA